MAINKKLNNNYLIFFCIYVIQDLDSCLTCLYTGAEDLFTELEITVRPHFILSAFRKLNILPQYSRIYYNTHLRYSVILCMSNQHICLQARLMPLPCREQVFQRGTDIYCDTCIVSYFCVMQEIIQF